MPVQYHACDVMGTNKKTHRNWEYIRCVRRNIFNLLYNSRILNMSSDPFTHYKFLHMLFIFIKTFSNYPFDTSNVTPIPYDNQILMSVIDLILFKMTTFD